MSDSPSGVGDYDNVRFRAVFIPDGETVDSALLEGMTDTISVRAELTLDEDDDAGSGSETDSSRAAPAVGAGNTGG